MGNNFVKAYEGNLLYNQPKVHFQAFHLFWKISIFFPKMPFLQNWSINLGRMTTGSKLEQSVAWTLFKNWQNNWNLASLSIESKWPSKLVCVALPSMENYKLAPLNYLRSVYIEQCEKLNTAVIKREIYDTRSAFFLYKCRILGCRSQPW